MLLSISGGGRRREKLRGAESLRFGFPCYCFSLNPEFHKRHSFTLLVIIETAPWGIKS